MIHEPPTLETTPVDLPPEIIALLASFTPLFSDRVWTKAQVLAIGALLATGHRTVCSVLRIMGLSHERHFTNYHRVLNRDAWSCLAAGQILLGLIVAVIPRDWPIVLAADDTIERRSGRRIKAKGCYRDPVRSSRKHLVKCFGLKWVVLMILVPVPWIQRVWAPPHRSCKASTIWAPIPPSSKTLRRINWFLISAGTAIDKCLPRRYLPHIFITSQN